MKEVFLDKYGIFRGSLIKQEAILTMASDGSKIGFHSISYDLSIDLVLGIREANRSEIHESSSISAFRNKAEIGFLGSVVQFLSGKVFWQK